MITVFLETFFFGTATMKPLLLRSLMISLVVRRERSSLAIRSTKNPSVIILCLEYKDKKKITFQEASATFLETYPHIEFSHWLP